MQATKRAEIGTSAKNKWVNGCKETIPSNENMPALRCSKERKVMGSSNIHVTAFKKKKKKK